MRVRDQRPLALETRGRDQTSPRMLNNDYHMKLYTHYHTNIKKPIAKMENKT